MMRMKTHLTRRLKAPIRFIGQQILQTRSSNQAAVTMNNKKRNKKRTTRMTGLPLKKISFLIIKDQVWMSIMKCVGNSQLLGLYPIIAKLNHSCSSNASVEYGEDYKGILMASK